MADCIERLTRVSSGMTVFKALSFGQNSMADCVPELTLGLGGILGEYEG